MTSKTLTRTAMAIALAILALTYLLGAFPHAQSAAAPRVQAGDLTYVGAFRLPSGADDEHTFKYGGRGLAFDARNGGLWLVGHDQQQWIAEVGIPTPSASTTLADLPTAPLLADWRDRLAGSMGPIGQSGVFVGGILPWGDGLVVSAYTYYDASKQATTSHVLIAADGSVSGPYRVGQANPGFVGGPMTPIPSEWQGTFGGPALTAQCCIPIISRTSLGPSATVFDPSKLADQDHAEMVVGYPIDHPTLGTYEGRDPSALFLNSTAFAGVVFPPGTSSVLFIGVQPGSACYGQGTSDPSLDGTPYNGTVYCYDPTNKYKGTHGYPYRGFVWAYDALDLAQVRQGATLSGPLDAMPTSELQPWDVKPYATWTLDAPFMSDARTAIQGATYDPATRRLFLSLGFADGTAPVIAVYQLAAEDSGSVNEHPPTTSDPDIPDTPPIVTPPPPTVTADAPTAVTGPASCRLSSLRAKMPSGGGWDAEFFDGSVSLGVDTSGPATRPARQVAGGVHAITVRWTKAGHDPIVTPPLVVECR